MGVYISGMEMPTGKDELRLIIHSNGQVIIDKKTYWEEAEAVPVPPHGRLIDASEKIRVQMYDDMTEDYHIAEMTIDDLLSQGWVEADAPTIIQANVPDNNVGNITAEEGD